MIDSCWLTKEVFQAASKYKFAVDSLSNEDSVSLNIRREIIETLQAQLVDLQESADVELTDSDEIKKGFNISRDERGHWHIIGANNGDLLHGLYYFIIHQYIGDLGNGTDQCPSQSIRMIDQWDNFDGSIERGYAGESIFYDNNTFSYSYSRIRQYARLLSSVGINYIAINNVNVHMKETFFISEENLPKIKLISDIFGEFGIKTLLSVNFASPIRFRDLDSSDPLDERVIEWWHERAKVIYREIPTFGGFLVKADSEGEPGPYSYGRNHAQGANMLAAAVKPFGGIVIWRAFVYNSQQDWRDRSIDRAKAAYDNFAKLDGKFAENAILQIKFGPIDFQTREPIQPLLNAMKHTNQIVEFQITQEYTGHQIDINYLLPQWVRVMKFNFNRDGHQVAVKNITHKNAVVENNCGIAAVSNIGRDENWTGNKLAQANLYGFGRLAWNSDLTASEILDEWLKLSINNETAIAVTRGIMLSSNQVYEDYTAPLGVGFMVNPAFHYGPGVDGYEFDRWGTYHFADRDGLGVDRTLKSGTGYTRQYDNHNFEIYENVDTCPDEVLLFFHHVSYNHILHSGKTVIQHIYDTHFSGVEGVKRYLAEWHQLKDVLPSDFYQNISERLDRQLLNAVNWRDQVNTFFYRMSGVKDAQSRKIYR